MTISYVRYLPHLLIAGALFGAGYHFGGLSGDVRVAKAEHALAVVQRDAAQQRALAEAQARAIERRAAERMADIAAQHEAEKREIEAETERVIAGLESGNLRLRQHWQGCVATSRVSGAAAGSAIADGAEQRRNEGSRDLVRIADQWDAKERALQRVIQSDRER